MVGRPGGQAVLRATTDYDWDGYGVRQYAPYTAPFDFGPWITGASAHLIFERSEVKDDQKAFMQRFILK